MRPIVLFFHQIVAKPRPDHYFFRQSLTYAQFRTAMEAVKEQFRCVSLEEVNDFRDRESRSVKPSILLTFDDGFRNNLYAAEILNDLGMTATFFILSECIDRPFVPWFLRFSHIMTTRTNEVANAPWGSVQLTNWLNRRRWLYRGKEYLLSLSNEERARALDELSEALGAKAFDATDLDCQFLTTADLRKMKELGMTLGCHGATHDNLSRLDESALKREMWESADYLEQVSQSKVDSISYPDGRYNKLVLHMARQRFKTGFTTKPSRWGGDEYQLGRRAADGVVDFTRLLSPWHPLECRLRATAKYIVDRSF
jgi:peptidoglycan/xylan/chitin deacetylase (PgdA/CDA1 family)